MYQVYSKLVFNKHKIKGQQRIGITTTDDTIPSSLFEQPEELPLSIVIIIN